MSNRGDRNGARKNRNVVRPSTRRNLLSGFDAVLQDVRARLSALIPASPVATARPTFEMLETRQLLTASPMVAAGDYVVYDSTNGDPQDVDIVALATGTTGLAASGVVASTSAADPDVIDLVINDPNAAAADNLIVNLVATGPINSITYNGSAGDTLVLNVILDGITYTNSTTLVAGGTATGLGFTIPAATAKTLAGDLQGAIADGDALTADGNLGNVNIDVDTTVRGGQFRNTAGNIGSLAFAGNVDLSNAASTTLNVQPGANNTVTSFAVTGTTTVGNNALTLTMGTGGTAGGSVTFTGAVTLGGSADLTIQTTGGAGNMGQISFGTVTLSGGNDSDLFITPGAGGNFASSVSFGGLVTLQDAGDHDVTIGNAGTSTYGTLSFTGITSASTNAGSDVLVQGGAITSLALGSATYLADNSGSMTFSFGGNVGGITGPANLTVSNDETQTDPILFTTTGTTGAISLGTLSNAATNTVADIQFNLGNDAADAVTSISIGSVLANNPGVTNRGDFEFVATGNITGSISITGAVTLGDTGDADRAALRFSAPDMSDVVLQGVWSINGNNSLASFIATDAASALGTVGSATWDVNFDANAAQIAFSAADGIGTFTARTVDFLAATGGGFAIDANSDNNDNTGSIGAIAVLSAGDDATNQTVFRGSVNATTGSSVSLAGGASGTFTARTPAIAQTVNTGGNGVWGVFTLGAGTVDDSVSDGLTINADDGITSITALGLRSTLINSAINANADTAAEVGVANVVGSLGAVNVVGQGGVNSLTGVWTAADFADVTLGNGNLNLNIASNVTVLADRAGFTSNLGNVLISTNGAITGGAWTLDDGVGNVTVNSIVPVNGTIIMAAINTDADNVTAAPAGALGGGLGNLTAAGGINIAAIDTDGTIAPAMGPAQTTQNAGAILAGDDIVIGTLDLGGSMPSITIVEPVSNLGANTITITTLAVNGNLDTIASAGGAGDNVTITGGTVGGDMDLVSAGLANLAGTWTVQGGTRGSPVTTFTDNAIDYIFDITGIWAAGINAPTVNYTVTFGGGDVNSLSIIDLEGTTDLTTDLTLATRANPTGTPQNYTTGLGGDTSNAKFSLNTFQDDFGPANDGRHAFDRILIEGDLNGDIGALANIAEASAGTAAILANPANFFLGHIKNLEVTGTFFNGATANPLDFDGAIIALQVDEFSFGALDVDHNTAVPGDGKQFDFDSPGLGGGDGIPVTGGNANGTVQDLEVFTTLTGITGTDVVIPVPDGGSITKSFVGPTGALEFIRLTDTDADGVVDTAVMTFVNGVITDIHLFGENIGLEYNALDPLHPATNSSTNITYGEAKGGVAATTFTNAGAGSPNVIDFIEFSSALGNIHVIDTVPTDQFATNVGSIIDGYAVIVDGQSDFVNPLDSYINNPNQTGVGQTLRTSLAAGTAGNVPVYAGTQNITVDGSIGMTPPFRTVPVGSPATTGVVTSGGVAAITTNDTVAEAVPVASAAFGGLVTDGGAAAITIAGSVNNSLVVGDAVVLALGSDNALGGAGTAADTIGINGTPAFTGPINVARNLGSGYGDVYTRVDNVTGFIWQIPAAAPGGPVAAGNLLALGFAGDQISGPDGVTQNITVGRTLRAAVISGKRILVDQTENQNDDDISGNVLASTIGGDVWSGDDIGTGVNGATQIFANGAYAGPDLEGFPGFITGFRQVDNQIDIVATGASAGDITSNIRATGDIVNILIRAGGGTGGSLLANVVAGVQTAAEAAAIPQLVGHGSIKVLAAMVNPGPIAAPIADGSFIPAILGGGTNQIIADQDIGALGVNVVSAADNIYFDVVAAGVQAAVDPATPTDLVDGGNVNSDFLAGVRIGQFGPIETNVNEANLPIFQNENDSITIVTMQAGWTQDSSADADAIATNDNDSNLNGTLAAAGSITVSTMQIDVTRSVTMPSSGGTSPRLAWASRTPASVPPMPWSSAPAM